MANSWFRLYSEFADDPKVQMMSEAMQRRLVMLFCCKCKGETFHETERAFHWRISESELAETKALFIQKGLIDENWTVLNWDRRQFVSDSSTDRVRQYRRGKKQDETLHVTPLKQGATVTPVTVTPPDTDTDADAEQKTPRDPFFVAQGVLQEAGLAGKEVLYALESVCRSEMTAGRGANDLLAAMVSAWKSYAPVREKMVTPWGALKFFGEGHWKQPGTWKVKKEASPPSEKPKESTLLERIAEQKARTSEQRSVD